MRAYELAPAFVLTVKREGPSLTALATRRGVTHLIAEFSTRFGVRAVPAAFEFKVVAIMPTVVERPACMSRLAGLSGKKQTASGKIAGGREA